MSQIRLKRDRVHLGAFVDRKQADKITQLARETDQSVSRIIRRAIRAELDRGTKATT